MTGKQCERLSISMNYMKNKSGNVMVKVAAFLLTTLFMSGLVTKITPCFAETAITGRTVYEFHEKIGEKNTTLDVPVIPGINYLVYVSFTGREEDIGKEKLKPVRIYYEDVDSDQCYPNIHDAYIASGVDDRSALLYEIPTFGVIEEREFTVAAVDDTLRLLFVGDAELIEVIVTPEEPKEAGEKRTIFVIGDSLVQTYNSSDYPMNGWGQRLNECFTDDIVVSNHAIGGRSTMNFIKQGRLNRVLTQVRPGDYVFVTFGHNDAGSVPGRGCTVEKYSNYLENMYIKGVRQRGGIPVMVTLGNQNSFNKNDGLIMQSFPAYVNAMKEVAAKTDCLLIDLNEKSRKAFQKIYDELGLMGMQDLVFHSFRAGIYENAINGAGDGTHFQTYGAKLLASLVAEGVYEQKLDGLYEYYIPPVVYDEVPGNIGKIELNTKDFDEKYTHMEWLPADNTDYYLIERAEMAEDGTVTDFELLGYSPLCRFGDAKREEGKTYCYRVFGVNNKGRSESASELLAVGEKADEFIEKLTSPVITPEITEIPEQVPETSDTAEKADEVVTTQKPDDTDLEQTEKQEENRKKEGRLLGNRFFIGAICIALGALIGLIYCTASSAIKKKRKNENGDNSDDKDK